MESTLKTTLEQCQIPPSATVSIRGMKKTCLKKRLLHNYVSLKTKWPKKQRGKIQCKVSFTFEENFNIFVIIHLAINYWSSQVKKYARRNKKAHQLVWQCETRHHSSQGGSITTRSISRKGYEQSSVVIVSFPMTWHNWTQSPIDYKSQFPKQ